MADGVLQQEHLGQGILGGEQGGGAGTLVLLAGAQDALDGGLVLVLHGSQTGSGHLHLDGKQVCVVEHRADAVLVHLVLAGSGAAVTDQDGTGDLLVQLQAHLALQPCNDVETGDVNDVVAVHLLLLVDGGGAGGAAQQAKDLFLLEVTLDVALGTCILLGQVSEHALEAAEGDVMHSAHHLADPGLVLVDDAGRVVQHLVVGEQPLHVVDAVAQVGQLLTGDVRVLESRLHGAAALGTLDNSVDVADAVLQHGLGGIIVKHILLHGRILLTVIVLFTGRNRTNDCVYYFFLLLRQGVEHIRNGLFLAHVLFVRHFGFLLCCFVVGHGIAAVRTVCKVFKRVALGVHAMGQAQAVLVIDKGLAALVILIGAVLYHLVDERTRVAACQYEAHFPDKAVFHGLTHLLQTVGIDGKSAQVAVLHASLSRPAGVRIVELGVAVYALGPVLQQTVADDIVHARVIVVVHHRHGLAVALLKGVRRDGQSIVTAGVGLRGPTAAIVIDSHFEIQHLLSKVFMFLTPTALCPQPLCLSSASSTALRPLRWTG